MRDVFHEEPLGFPPEPLLEGLHAPPDRKEAPARLVLEGAVLLQGARKLLPEALVPRELEGELLEGGIPFPEVSPGRLPVLDVLEDI